MMDKQDLYANEEAVYRQKQAEKQKDENKAYFDGMEKGAYMMKSVCDHLQEEKLKGGE